MAEINSTISIITLNGKGLSTSIKRQIIRVDPKNKKIKMNQLYVVYKKPTLNIKTHAD